MKFQPGQSGNPGGRPKGLADAVRTAVGPDGRKLVDAWLLIATAASETIETKYGARPTVGDRLRALDALADRGYGKVPQPVSGEDGGPIRVVFGGRHRAA